MRRRPCNVRSRIAGRLVNFHAARTVSQCSGCLTFPSPRSDSDGRGALHRKLCLSKSRRRHSEYPPAPCSEPFGRTFTAWIVGNFTLTLRAMLMVRIVSAQIVQPPEKTVDSETTRSLIILTPPSRHVMYLLLFDGVEIRR